MVSSIEDRDVASADVATLPLAPRNPLPLWRQLTAARAFHTGPETLRDAGGPVTRVILGPKRLMPPVVIVTSPQGARDVLGRTDAVAERGETPMATELRRLMGGNLLVLPHDEWLPRRRAVQPLFTKKHVQGFGGHMAEAAQQVSRRWASRGEIDLDAQCRTLTLRALGRSVLGLDLDERADAIGPALRTALKWTADRMVRPVKAPRWLPTPAQRRAHAANASLHRLAAEILQTCRADPDRDAPLVRALLAARDPQTGRPLYDDEICDELVLFMLAGHDTTSTVLSYALWALGRHCDVQDRVAAEVADLPDRALTHEDVPRLGYTVQVLHEALRLCPPGASVARTVMHDIAVDGFRLEAGTLAVVGIYAMHRDPELWDDPLVFDPDRFSKERSAGRSRWQYLPFGAGRRSCVGDHFAMLEATLALATIVRQVEIRSLDDDFPVATPFTLVAAAPIRAQVQPRDVGHLLFGFPQRDCFQINIPC
jgi:cytochrome P450